MAKDQEGTLCREHVDLYSCKFSDVLSPDTTCIDGDRGIVLFSLLCNVVIDLNTLYGVTLFDEACHFAVHLHSCTVKLCVDHVGRCESERVHRSIRNLYSSDDVRVGRRLHPQRLLRVDDFCSDACLKARFHKFSLVSKIIFRKCEEQTFSLLHAMSCNFAENHILLDTLFS